MDLLLDGPWFNAQIDAINVALKAELTALEANPMHTFAAKAFRDYLTYSTDESRLRLWEALKDA